MQALAQISHRVPAHRHVLNEPQDAPPVLHCHALLALQILLQQRPGNFIAEFEICRERDKEPSGQVLSQACNFIGQLGHVVLANVRHHNVWQEIPGGRGLTAVRGCHGSSCNVLIEIGYLHQLVLDVRCLCHSVVVSDGCCRAQHDIAKPSFANVGAAVVGGEPLHQDLGEVNLPVHEDILGWYVHVLKACQRLLAAKLRVALVNVAWLHGAQVAALPAVDVGQPRSIHRHRARHGEVLIGHLHLATWHDDHPVGVEIAGLMCFAPSQDDAAVGLSLRNSHKQVRVFLLRWTPAAISLHICHGTSQY
mmetsp:Transcript_66387/g.158398  ORF Transcript_66387/g.158398 Transcript_66387/m.158398 type:complete len:307 (-) Transcript_66387:716-1636(-)